ncbi:hypothetical protein HUE58_01665 [Candidatus Ruthia endofausta]|uniref:Uncharacterized protein n=1 Tax=Candidatus Ruthia endofausta TaxID=2738852 RepID=A0A6N0HNJ1_9GAMM|nr:hypothetical protein [Candidatus Ruthia endofausta]QKQ23908.1 hypothetical protein HUE58_01665 [Candidatus Ruthia endofausta]
MTLKQWVKILLEKEKPTSILVFKDDLMCELLMPGRRLMLIFVKKPNVKTQKLNHGNIVFLITTSLLYCLDFQLVSVELV